MNFFRAIEVTYRLMPPTSTFASLEMVPKGRAARKSRVLGHARRYFVEAQLSDSARALVALGFVKELHKIDHAVSAMPPHVRTDERARLAVPVLDALAMSIQLQQERTCKKLSWACCKGRVTRWKCDTCKNAKQRTASLRSTRQAMERLVAWCRAAHSMRADRERAKRRALALCAHRS